MSMNVVEPSELSPAVFEDIRKNGAKAIAGTGCIIMSKSELKKIMDTLGMTEDDLQINEGA